MRFFQPEVHGLTSDYKRSGKVATSEIPLLYYFMAILYRLFGYHEWIYRSVNTLIFFMGLFSLFRLFQRLKLDGFISTVFSLLFFASPVLVYYGNNFLTDIAAFSFALMAWNQIVAYYQKEKLKYYGLALVSIFLAMAMKVSAGISLLTWIAVTILNLLFSKETYRMRDHVARTIRLLLPLFLVMMTIALWIWYARRYNTIHATNYFSTTIMPIWEISSVQISQTLHHIRVLWLKQYFHPVTLFFFLALTILNLVFWKKTSKFLFIASNVSLFGAILYLILWYEALIHHDYYTINLYIALVLVLITSAEWLNRMYPGLVKSWVFRILSLAFLAFNVFHTERQMHDRYHGWWNDHEKYRDFDSITPYLRSLGISRHDTVVSLPDGSHNTLYLMNQPGWTTCYSLNLDSVSLRQSIDHGARYLILASQADLDASPFLRHFSTTRIGTYGSVLVFDLAPFKNNIR